MTTSVEPELLTGECYCRAIAYSVPDAFEYALICHCSDCRRATGSASKPFAGIAADQLQIVRGAEHVTRIGDPDTHNAFCGRCGSLLYSLVREGRTVHVTLGTLTSSPSRPPSAHIFVASKADWDAINDDLPQFAEFPTRSNEDAPKREVE